MTISRQTTSTEKGNAMNAKRRRHLDAVRHRQERNGQKKKSPPQPQPKRKPAAYMPNLTATKTISTNLFVTDLYEQSDEFLQLHGMERYIDDEDYEVIRSLDGIFEMSRPRRSVPSARDITAQS